MTANKPAAVTKAPSKVADEKPKVQDERPETPDKQPSELDAKQGKSEDGRPACLFKGCERPEFDEHEHLCGAHYALRPDLRKAARRV